MGKGKLAMSREIFLANMAIKHNWKIGAEVGVWYGRTFFHLLMNVPDLILYGVDTWKPGGHVHHHKDQEQNKKDVLENAAMFSNRAIVLNMPSVEAAATIANNSLDFVFIDADHSFDAVCADIEAWTLKVKSGGYLTGHDWDWDSVMQAVVTILPEATPGTKENDFVWVWRKP